MPQLALIISTLFAFTAANTASACKTTYYYDPNFQTSFPYYPLGICLRLLDGGSFTRICDENGDLQIQQWDYSTNCTGHYWFPSFDYLDYNTTVVECNGIECDYAMYALHPATDECDIHNDDFLTIAVVVNYCIEADEYHPVLNDPDETVYFSATCSNSAIVQHIHMSSDCSDTGYIIDGASVIDGDCFDWGIRFKIEIVHCTPTNIPWDHFAFYVDILQLVCGVIICAYSWVIFKILSNLYEFEVKSPPICIKILFSDKHNWLTEPSKSNKIYALLSPITNLTCYILQAIFIGGELWGGQWTPVGFISVVEATYLFKAAGQVFNVLFMASILEYHMNASGLIKQMISTKYMKGIKLVAILNGLLIFIADTISLFRYFRTLESLLNYVDPIAFLCVELSLLYLYYRGMNNVCHYWYSKEWKEYDKYGENERTHEILIDISRVSVVVMSLVIFSLMVTMLNVYSDIGDEQMSVSLPLNGYMVFETVFATILTVLSTFSIYFIYPFGHIHYQKVFCICNTKMYNYFKRKHQKEVENGAFDGVQYQSYKKNKCLCFCNRKRNEENMEAILNDSDIVDDDL